VDDLVNTPTACYHRRVLPSKLNKIPGDRMTPLTHHKYGVVAVKKWVQGTEILMVALCQNKGLGLGGSTALQEASGRGSGGTCHLQTMEVVVLQPMGK